MRTLAAFLIASLAAPSAGPLKFSLQAAGEKEARATISGPAADLPPGPFRGSLTLNGSAAELPVSGTVEQPGGAGGSRSS